MSKKIKLLMIDNYDSFTYNIVQYFGELGAEVEVFRNDEITVEGIAARQPDRLDGKTINWTRLEMQPADDQPVMLSFLNKSPIARQISCGVTHTSERTHDIIRKNL